MNPNIAAAARRNIRNCIWASIGLAILGGIIIGAAWPGTEMDYGSVLPH